MKFLVQIDDVRSYSLIQNLPVDEILVSTERFSKTGRLEDHKIKELCNQIQKAGGKAILEWNSISTDSEIEAQGEFLKDLCLDPLVVRFADPGVGAYLSANLPQCELQFETGARCLNVMGILKWSKLFGPNLKRLVLPNLLPINQVSALANNTDLELEILGLGRIEVFYSQRKLLSPLMGETGKVIRTRASSEDRPMQVSEVLETDKGTVMYFDKDLYLLDKMEEIETAGVSHLLLAPYEHEHFELLSRYYQKGFTADDLKICWPKKTTKGFFRGNQTQKPLVKLTNKHHRAYRDQKVGVVLESKKRSHTVIELFENLSLPRDLVWISPEGHRIERRIETLEKLDGTETGGVVPPGYYLMPWVKYGVPSTFLIVESFQTAEPSSL